MKTIEDQLSDLRSIDIDIRRSIEAELLYVKEMDRPINVHVDELGFAAYFMGDSPNFLTTLHNGSIVPRGINLRQDSVERHNGEDNHTFELYFPLFLELEGCFVTSHVSRYVVDLNRRKHDAIFKYGSGDINLVRAEEHSIAYAKELYDAFYSYTIPLLGRSNILFSGHSMEDLDKRPDICIVSKENFEGLPLKSIFENEFRDVRINDPFLYEEGYFKCFAENFLQGDIIEIEINKKLYLEQSHKKHDFSDVSAKISRSVLGYLG